MKLEGYEKAEDAYKLNKDVVSYFEQKEKEIGREIVIKYGGFSITPAPRTSYVKKDPLVIYDWARPPGPNQLVEVVNESIRAPNGRVYFRVNKRKIHSSDAKELYPGIKFETSQLYAQVHKNTIWSLFAIANYGRADCYYGDRGYYTEPKKGLQTVFDPVFERVINWDTYEDKKQEQLITKIKQGLNAGLITQKSDIQKNIESNQKQLNNYLAAAGVNAKAIRESRLMLERLGDQEKHLDSQAESQLQELSTHKNLDSYDMDSSSNLVMTTNELWIYNQSKTRRAKLGIITIKANLLSNIITIVNSNKSPHGFHHPHIGGSICWGNVDILVYRMLTKADFPGLFNVIIKFLETYQEDHYGYDARWWFDIRHNPKAVVESYDRETKQWSRET